MSNDHILFSLVLYDGYPSPIDHYIYIYILGVNNGQLHYFIFLIPYIWCISEHKIVENGSSSIYTNNHHNFSHIIEDGKPGHIEPLEFFLVKIGLTTLFPFLVTQICCLGDYKIVEK